MFTARTRLSICWSAARRRSSAARRRCLCPPAPWATRSPSACTRSPGQEVIAESRAHILDWEMATTAVFSGCLIRAVPAEGGILTWKQIEPVIQPWGRFAPPPGSSRLRTRRISPAGGCTPLAVLEEIWDGAKERKLPTHLDGARIFNAAVALGVDVKDAHARIRHGDVLPVEGTGRAGGVDAGGFGGADAQGAHLPQGAGRRHAAGRRAGRGRTDRAGRWPEAAARRSRQCAICWPRRWPTRRAWPSISRRSRRTS